MALERLRELFLQRQLRTGLEGIGRGPGGPTPPIPVPPPRPPQPPARRSQSDDLLEGLFRDPVRSAAFSAGLTLLGSQGDPSSLPRAYQVAAQAYRQGLELRAAEEAAAAKAEADARRAEVLARYADASEVPELQALAIELIGLGDEDSLKIVQQLSPLIRALGGDEPFRVVQGVPLDPETGQPVPGAVPQYMMVGPDGKPRPTGVGVAQATPETMSAALTLQQRFLDNVKPLVSQYRVISDALPLVELAKKGNTAAQAHVLAAFIEAMTASQAAPRPALAEFVQQGRPFLERARTVLDRIRGQGEVAPPELIAEIGPILSRARVSMAKEIQWYQSSALEGAQLFGFPASLYRLPEGLGPEDLETLSEVVPGETGSRGTGGRTQRRPLSSFFPPR